MSNFGEVYFIERGRKKRCVLLKKLFHEEKKNAIDICFHLMKTARMYLQTSLFMASWKFE